MDVLCDFSSWHGAIISSLRFIYTAKILSLNGYSEIKRCKTVKPHKFFREDFDQLVVEGKRQEYLLTVNAGEHDLVKNMYEFFDATVLPLIISDDWVFEAANRFATEYAMDCFRLLRSTGAEVYQAQKSLMDIKNEVQKIISDAKATGYLVKVRVQRIRKSQRLHYPAKN